LLGFYGVVASGVARRTNEIGVRMALGPSRPDVLSMILREAAVLIPAGVINGLTGRSRCAHVCVQVSHRK
jgi:ABC-type antimicrobial peptide transport system permease subunit